ncbi:MAG: TRAP transporter substrate-binding protein [Variovorax sp.]|nr:MAG: TRAP transporter substrate-binding protein [Variovorax sp.]
MHANSSLPATGTRRAFVQKTSALAAAAFATGIAAPAIGQQARVLRFGHSQAPDTNVHEAITLFGKELSLLSSNKMKAEIFPASQLGGLAEMLQSVQAGSLSMTMAVPAWYSGFIRPLDAFTLPYMVSSEARLRTALDGTLGKELARHADSAGFVLIGNLLLGARHIVNKRRPVNTPADCKGLKVRVINSQVYIQTFRALGANPVAMDPSALYLALQQGVIDGFEFPLQDLMSARYYEVAKYVSLDRHTIDFYAASMNKALWTSLAPEEQAMVNAAMKTAMGWQWRTQPLVIAEADKKLRGLIAVNDISPANRKLFQEATLPVYQRFENQIGKAFVDLAVKELG